MDFKFFFFFQLFFFSAIIIQQRIQIQMIKPFLQYEEVNKLNSIIDQANKSFLKESRLSNNLSFNILRVLSAFRLMYPDSPPSLYNSIIYLTKNYNPSSFKQWKEAVYQLSKLKKHVPKEKHTVSRQQIPIYMKTYQNSFNKQRIEDGHFQSKSFAQIKIPADLNLSEQSGSIMYDHQNKDVSQTNAETGKRQFYTKTDTTQQQDKNHYISFQPYHHISGIYPHSYFQKENVNSTNIGESRKKDSSYQYLQAIRRDLGKTTKNSLVKSPIDQSFIKNIDCYQSPYLLTHPDLLLPVDPEEQRMNQRAYGFLRYNLLFKSFSSILANTLVLQKAKQYRLKAETQNKSNTLQKSFQALRHNLSLSKIIRKKQNDADVFFSFKLKGKVMSVLKLIFELRNKIKPINVQALNRSSYEFVLKMLLSTEKQDQNTSQKWIDFSHKIDELIKKDQIDKVCMVVKYFGKHSWINQEAVQNLISSYRISICKLIFRSLKSQQKDNLKFYDKREKKLVNKAFKVLQSRWIRIKSYNKKIIESEAHRNQMLLKTVMKALLQIVYSSKLYSKRYEYLQKKKEMNSRKNILEMWLKRTRQQLARFQHLKQNIKISQLSLNKFYKNYALRAIMQDGEELQEKASQLQNKIFASKSKALNTRLKQMVRRRCKDLKIREEIKNLSRKSALIRWKSKTRKGKGISLIFGVIKKYAFRCFVSPVLKESLELMSEIKQGQIKNAKLVLKQWRNWCQVQIKKYELLIQNFQTKQLFTKKVGFISLLKYHCSYEQNQRSKVERNAKFLTIVEYLQLKANKMIFSNLERMRSKRQKQKVKAQQVKKGITIREVKLTFNLLQSRRKHNLKIDLINTMLFEERAALVIKNISCELLKIKYKKISNLRKTKSLNQLGKIAILLKKNDCSAQKQAEKHIQLKYMTKVIIGLCQLIQKSNELREFLKQAYQWHKSSLVKQQINQLRNINRIKKIGKRLNKKFFFNIFRSKKEHLNRINELLLNNCQNAAKRIVICLKFKLQNNQNAALFLQKANRLMKYVFVNRIQKYFLRSLIYKKYLFMSMKYRALKMSSATFDAWKNKKNTHKIIIKPKERMLKGKERLSTDVI